MYSGSITKSEDDVSDVDIGDGGCSGVHVNISSSTSMGSAIPFGTRTGLNGLMVTGDGGALNRLVSFLWISVTAIRAMPIKAYSSMPLPNCLYELVMDYKYSMEQHERHARLMNSLHIFFEYVRFRRFIQCTVEVLLQ